MGSKNKSRARQFDRLLSRAKRATASASGLVNQRAEEFAQLPTPINDTLAVRERHQFNAVLTQRSRDLGQPGETTAQPGVVPDQQRAELAAVRNDVIPQLVQRVAFQFHPVALNVPPIHTVAAQVSEPLARVLLFRQRHDAFRTLDGKPQVGDRPPHAPVCRFVQFVKSFAHDENLLGSHCHRIQPGCHGQPPGLLYNGDTGHKHIAPTGAPNDDYHRAGFPLDDLLVCAGCEGEISLSHGPEPRYRCRNSCATTFSASELNRRLIAEITGVVITDATFPSLKAHFARNLDESGDQGEQPSDDEIRRLVTDPETLMAVDAVPAAAELLATFIDRIELDTQQATIQYALGLPSGSNLAGSRSQQVVIPRSVKS